MLSRQASYPARWLAGSLADPGAPAPQLIGQTHGQRVDERQGCGFFLPQAFAKLNPPTSQAVILAAA